MPPQRRHGRFHAPRSGRPKRPRSYRVVCSGCGKEVITEVLPPEGSKLLCVECFKTGGPPGGKK